MASWQQKVREHLTASNLPRAIRDEVVSELAFHLEDAYENARASGMPDQAAINVALRQVGDWRALRPRRSPTACLGG